VRERERREEERRQTDKTQRQTRATVERKRSFILIASFSLA
jgi:hypothetical protein